MRETRLDILTGSKWTSRLISTMLMVLLLAVVLSTATFAWYVVSNVVTIGDMAFSVEIDESTTGISLSWHELEYGEYNSELLIEPVTDGNVLYPMIPKTLGVVGESTFESFAGSGKFNKGEQIENIADGFIVKLESISDTMPYLLREKDGTATEIYVTNWEPVPVEVTFTYEISAELYDVPGTNVRMEKPVATKFRSAIFTSDNKEGDLILRGLIAKDGQSESVIHYGVLEGNSNINDVESVSKTEKITFVVPAESYVKCVVAVWFDGVDMIDEDGANKVEYKMIFGQAEEETES